MKQDHESVDAYIAQFPEKTRYRLLSIRRVVIENAPGAIEGFSYRMPAYWINKKPLVYFGGFDNHIGFYATPTGHEKFKEKLSAFKQGKGSVQFPHNQELPLELIAEIVSFRVLENNQKKN